VQRWYAPLTIALESASSMEEISKLRDIAAQLLSGIDGEAARLEAAAFHDCNTDH